MALLDWFKPRPLWQSAEPAQRAAGVRQLGSHEQEVFANLVRTDADARVRRAAVQRLSDVTELAWVAGNDSEASVRAEAVELLLAAALHREDSSAETAFSALAEPRHLVAVAREARSTSLRTQAVARIQDQRALASVAKSADSGVIRLAALQRIEDPPLLAEVALKAEAKDVALAALERVDDREVRQAVATRARCKAAARRAQAALQEMARQEAEETARVKARAMAEAAEAAEAVVDQPVALSPPCEVTAEMAPAEPAATTLPEQEPSATVDAAAPEEPAGQDEAQRVRLLELCEAAEALAAAGASPQAPDKLAALKADWALATSVGSAPDLKTRFEAALGQLTESVTRERAERERVVRDHLARSLDICQRLEDLAKAAAPPLGEASRAFRESKEILDDPGRFPTKQDKDQVLARLKAARAQLFPKLQELREADEWTRWANVSIQEELCGRMEALSAREDLPAVAREVQDLQERWKQARQAPKEQAEPLWLRFKAARDRVMVRVEAHLAQRKAEQTQNLEKKQALCGQAETLQDSTEWVKTAAELQRLQAEWKTLGQGPRRQDADLNRRFQRACHLFFERRKADLAQRKGEWAQNLEKKQALIVQVEALRESTAWDQVISDVKRLQAEWKATGPVRRSQSEPLWQRFRAACDAAFDRYKKRDELTLLAQRQQREALLAGVERLLAQANAGEAIDLAGQLQALLTEWRRLPDLPRGEGAELEARLLAARDRLVAAAPAAFMGTDLDLDANRLKLEKLLAKVEALVPAEAGGEAAVSSADLAVRLKEALATNTMGGRSAEEARWRAVANDLEAAQSAWRRVGPAGEVGGKLKQRFDDACRRLLAAKKQAGF